MLGYFITQGLAALGVVGAEIDVDETPVISFYQSGAKTVDIVIAAINGHQGRVMDCYSHQLARFHTRGDENVGFHICFDGMGSDTSRQVTG
ncbi:hypothetical protein ES703_120089 [subsurface metagenome]